MNVWKQYLEKKNTHTHTHTSPQFLAWLWDQGSSGVGEVQWLRELTCHTSAKRKHIFQWLHLQEVCCSSFPRRYVPPGASFAYIWTKNASENGEISLQISETCLFLPLCDGDFLISPSTEGSITPSLSSCDISWTEPPKDGGENSLFASITHRLLICFKQNLLNCKVGPCHGFA